MAIWSGGQRSVLGQRGRDVSGFFWVRFGIHYSQAVFIGNRALKLPEEFDGSDGLERKVPDEKSST